MGRNDFPVQAQSRFGTGRPMPCTSVEDVHVICLLHGRRGRASRPAAGCAAHAFGGSEDGRASLYGDGLVRLGMDGSAADGEHPVFSARPPPHRRHSSDCNEPAARAPARRPRRRRLPGSRPRRPPRKAAKKIGEAFGSQERPKGAKKAARKAGGQPSSRHARAPERSRRLLVRSAGSQAFGSQERAKGQEGCS